MVGLMTLKGLESIAEKEFEEQADKWVRAIAQREKVDFDELRPYLVSLYDMPGSCLEIVFVIPRHTSIKLLSDYAAFEDKHTMVVPKIEGGKLVGNYVWFAFRININGSASFHGVRNLGHALLLARWAYDEDEKAKWA